MIGASPISTTATSATSTSLEWPRSVPTYRVLHVPMYTGTLLIPRQVRYNLKVRGKGNGE